MKIAGFFPSEMRVEMVREMVEKMGIRPVSNSIGVNSKTVYKYKLGEAVPRDETFIRLLEVLREKDPNTFWGYVEKLQRGFEEALSSLKSGGERGSKVSRAGETQFPLQEAGEVSRFEVYERLGIENPSERVRLARVLSFLATCTEFGAEELEERVMLPRDEAEEYLRRLVQHGLLERTKEGVYRVRIRCRL